MKKSPRIIPTSNQFFHKREISEIFGNISEISFLRNKNKNVRSTTIKNNYYYFFYSFFLEISEITYPWFEFSIGHAKCSCNGVIRCAYTGVRYFLMKIRDFARKDNTKAENISTIFPFIFIYFHLFPLNQSQMRRGMNTTYLRIFKVSSHGSETKII